MGLLPPLLGVSGLTFSARRFFPFHRSHIETGARAGIPMALSASPAVSFGDFFLKVYLEEIGNRDGSRQRVCQFKREILLDFAYGPRIRRDGHLKT